MLVQTNAQQIQFEQISTDDGLSQNSVISIAQDSSGFLWFATQDGLNKYDGSNFSQYEVFFRDITGKNFNQLGKIIVDTKGRVWMTTLDGGLQFVDPVTEKFTYIDGIQEASFVFQSTKSEFWVSSFSNGLYRLTEEENGFKIENVLLDRSVSKIMPLGEDLLMITQTGLTKYNIESSNTESLLLDLENISDVEIYNQDQFIISTLGNGVYISNDLDSLKLLEGIPEHLLVQDVFIDLSNRIWIATYGDGVYLVDGSHNTHFRLNSLDATSINYNDVLSIFQDNDANIWFGTDGGGASYIVADRKPIYSITKNNVPENIPVDVPRAISKDADDNIWIGTSGKGLTMVSEDLEIVNHYDTESSGSARLISNRVMSLLHDTDQNLWVGTQDGGLMFKENGRDDFELIDSGLPCKTVWDIANAGKEHLWLCTRNEGLILMDKQNHSWEKLSVEKSDSALVNGNIRTIMDASGGVYYVGTEEGEVYEITKYKVLSKLSLNGKITGAIKSLFLDGANLWIGTQQAGILIHNLTTSKQIQIDKSTGLPNNVVYSILPQNGKYVWISTNKGVCQINKQRALEGESDIVNQHLTIESGLVSNEFNTGASYLDSKGKMYFGGIQGVNWFNSSEILKDNEPIDIVLLDLITTNRDGQDVKHINNSISIDLDHTDKNFQIRYVAQRFAKVKTRYRYKLEGINTEWVDNESNELVSFSNIPPGKYKLLLNATNNDGVWAKNPVQFDINIIPAFWQTLWFRLLAIIASFSLLWYLYHIRVNELKRTSLLKEQITKIEAKALKLQMNPHFLFNSLNAIDNYILKNEKIKASDYLSKFSKLMRQILDYSEMSNITLSQELETLELYIRMERLRFQEKFKYELKVDQDVNSDTVKLPPLILQPFVENAIWHGLMHQKEGGKLKIDIQNAKEGVKCIIDDDGIGRAHAKQIKTKSATKHKSHGIRITEERLNLNNELNKIGANILIEDKYDSLGNPTGTRVIIHLPNK